MSRRQGPPKHQNKYAWKPNAGIKINETEVGGKLRPLSEITGVCHKCKEQIDWKRKYGKYKPLSEPTKCQKCGKRAVKQAYHKICTACSKELGQCAKCCCSVSQTVGRDIEEIENEKKQLEEAIKNARERERRTLLRAMNKGKSGAGPSVPKIAGEGDKSPATSVDEYAKKAGHDDDDDAYDDDVSDDDKV
ncbi:hypothetical protein FCM35_KLT07602 [Carex littledalei]|uniref:Uncharacterized protein n=1 Tax=Carex littledalei TaxID=544730 RepID=A0A833QZW7_9POAL|nr:hypothetical protein FCM35_KLT07602 [Carex littledalei]